MIRYLFTLLVLTLTNLSAAESMKLTLSEAVRLALAQNRVLKIARLKVVESEQKKAAAKSSYFPENQESINGGPLHSGGKHRDSCRRVRRNSQCRPRPHWDDSLIRPGAG